MRHSILISLMMLGFLSIAPKTIAAVVKDQKTTSVKALKKQKVIKTTVNLQPQKTSQRTTASKTKKVAKLKKSSSPKVSRSQKKSHLSMAKNKQYWSVQCINGFIKDNYVYCSRKNVKMASLNKSKVRKLASHKAAQKATPVIKR